MKKLSSSRHGVRRHSSAAGGSDGLGSNGGVTGHLGHVLDCPQIVTVYWDPSFVAYPAVTTPMDQFISDLVKGPFMGRLTQYGVNLGELIASYVIDTTAYPPPKSLDEDGVADQLFAWFDDGVISELPTLPTSNLVYVIFPPLSTSLSYDGPADWGGYHNHKKYKEASRDNVFWAVLRIYDTSSTGWNFVDSIAYLVGHELCETFTNRDTKGYYNDESGSEIGDLCELKPNGKCCQVFPYLGWKVEPYWSQSDSVCVIPLGLLAHTIRKADGTWPTPLSDVQAQTTGAGLRLNAIQRVSCAATAGGELHVCAINDNGVLWYTRRNPDGSWIAPLTNVLSVTPPSNGFTADQRIPFAACATAPNGDFHVCALDADCGLWHTVRPLHGFWHPFGDVQAQIRLVGANPGIGPTPYVACAASITGELHICALDGSGGLWHTIRRTDGTWPFAFGDVQAQTRQVGPNAGIGPLRAVACAVSSSGDLHVCVIDRSGGIWHTIRAANGAWPYAFGDVQNEVRKVGPNVGIGTARAIACSVASNGDLHLCIVDFIGVLWHTIRRADGTWPFVFGQVQAETRLAPGGADIGPTPFVSCAVGASDELHVCAIASNQS